MYCPNCGHDVEDASFCPYCGTSMTGYRDPWGIDNSKRQVTKNKEQMSESLQYTLAFVLSFTVAALLGFFIGVFVLFITGAFFIGATGGKTRSRKTAYYVMFGLIAGTATGFVAGMYL